MITPAASSRATRSVTLGPDRPDQPAQLGPGRPAVPAQRLDQHPVDVIHVTPLQLEENLVDSVFYLSIEGTQAARPGK